VAVIVHRPGLLLTVQDAGRWGSQADGVPVAGPMDPWSYRLANLALGNPPHAAMLEATLVGPELECEGPASVAVTGAAFAMDAGGRAVESPAVFVLDAGARIRFRERLAGARAYVAFAGGIDVPPVLGSRSTDIRSGFGGLDGRPLRAGDRLRLGPPPATPVRDADLAFAASRLPRPGEATCVRVVPAPGRTRDPLFHHLAAGTFVVSTRSDRMGYRLEGATLPGVPASRLLSTPTVTGLVQVPPGGEPILLMADRQTTGGYLPVAVVIAADLPLAGQLAPGDTLQFRPCEHEDARRALLDAERLLAELHS
jgi:antagonist of KipI